MAKSETQWDGPPPVLILGGDTYRAAEYMASVREIMEQRGIEHESFDSVEASLGDVIERFRVTDVWGGGEGRLYEFRSQKEPVESDLDALLAIAGDDSGNFLAVRFPSLRSSNKLKELSQVARVVKFAAPPSRKNDLVKWLNEVADEKEIRISRDGAFELVSRIGSSQGALEKALDVMELSKSRNEVWNADKIRQQFFLELDLGVFDLTDAMCSRDMRRARDIASTMLGRGEPAPKVVSAMYGHFRKLLLLALHREWNESTGSERLRVSPRFLANLRRQAGRMGLPKLKKAYRELYNLDCDSKMGGLSDFDLIENFLLRFFSA